MALPARKTVWLWTRRLFRWLRICCWTALLVFIIGFIYLNSVGLPDFVKKRVVANLHDRGLDLEFKRLRLRWYRGIVAERIQVGRAGQTNGPQLTLGEAELRLDGDALKKFEVKINSILVRDGVLNWPLLSSNQPPENFKIEKISTELRFQTNDLWEVDHFQARGFGINLNASGVITNALRLRERFPAKKRGAPAEEKRDPEAGLRQFVKIMEQVQFTSEPEIELVLGGDAAMTNNFMAEFKCKADGATTPWGNWEDFALRFGVAQNPGANSVPHASLQLDIESVQTQWATGKVARLTAQFGQSTNDPTALQADWALGLSAISTRWASGSNLQFTGESIRPTNSVWAQTKLELRSGQLKTDWVDSSSNRITARVTHQFTNAIPARAETEIEMIQPNTRWGKSEAIKLRLEAVHNTNAAPQADASWGAWAPFEPFAIDWDIHVVGLDSPKLTVADFNCRGNWRAPELKLKPLKARLYGGGAELAAELNVATRRLSATAELDFDIQQIKPLFNTNGQRWIGQFSWDKAPQVNGKASLILPPWTEAKPDWKSVMPSLALEGKVKSGPGGYRGVMFDSAHTDFKLADSEWNLPNLTAHRAEGDAILDYTSHTITQDYHWGIKSTIDPNILKPFFETDKEKKIFDMIQLTRPPTIEADIWGRWYARERTAFDAKITITNFVFRGEGCSNITAKLHFTNSFLTMTDIRIDRGEEFLTGELATIDFKEDPRLYFTNVFSTLDPMAAMKTIGPKTVDAIRPYHFERPPTIRTYGSLRFTDIATTDLHFDVVGGPFNYWKFNLTNITGGVHWVTNRLILTDVKGPFYKGTLKADAEFDFAPENGTTFHFDAVAKDSDLHDLIGDLVNPTNKLEGGFSTDLHITSAHSANWDSWQGYGVVAMKDGLLWEVPIFGIFSPVLNGFSSGLGNSRASEVKATYHITNSVIYTSDMEIHSAPVRLRYDGTVDFNGKVNAHMEAEIWRETPLIGQLLRIFTKIFEYKITGSLAQPKSEPLYIPKLFQFPFRPFKTIKDLFSSPGEKPATEPKAKPEPKTEPKPEEKPEEKPDTKPEEKK